MIVARLRISLILALACAVVVPTAHASASRNGHPRIVFARCSSDPYPCVAHKVVTRTGKLLVGAGGMSRRAKVVFPVRSRAGGRIGLRAVGGRFRTATRIVVRVPG